MKQLLALAAVLMISTSVAQAQSDTENPQVTIHTNYGDIRVELFPKEAPVTVSNFLQYVNDGFYEGTIFHRVIGHFMIQGGGMAADGQQKLTRDPIKNEADNGLKNVRGTVAMARTDLIDSATSQFFINVERNGSLDHKGKDNSRDWGYTVFGRVTEGMEGVVDEIRFVPTSRGDVPNETVLIESIEIHSNNIDRSSESKTETETESTD